MQRDIWVELNDIDAEGCVTAFTDAAVPGVDLSVGSRLIAGDDEGNFVPAVVVKRYRRRKAVLLKLELSRLVTADRVDESVGPCEGDRESEDRRRKRILPGP